MANVTTKTGLNQAEDNGPGLQAVICRVSISATTSAGDVLRIGRLPHRAIPLDVVFYTGAAYVDNTIHKFGLSGTEACFLSSHTYSTAAGVAFGNATKANVNLNLLESYTSKTDAAAQQFTYVTMTPTLALTAGHACTLVVYYKTPGQSL
jgi:hypothetical protein